MCSTLQKILPALLILIIIHIALSLLAWVPVLRFLQLYTDCKIFHSLLSLKSSAYQNKFLSHVLKLKAYLSFINNTKKCQIIQINILKKTSYANSCMKYYLVLSLYNKSCNIQHFQNQRNAGYHNILDIRYSYFFVPRNLMDLLPDTSPFHAMFSFPFHYYSHNTVHI